MLEELDQLTTEKINEQSLDVDLMESQSIIELMNSEDQKVAAAVKKGLPEIAKAIDLIVKQMKSNGRLIYVGAGTSGRLGILDAAECPPTFGISPDKVTFAIAGGKEAFLEAVEEAEDNSNVGKKDLQGLNLTKNDCVVAISASGRTPYCIGALQYAKKVNASTIALSCNQRALMSKEADVAIEIDVGPEILVGSTRLKAGTAQKMVLNMLSTATMIRLGKAFQNLMVDMRPTNLKLKDRAKRMVMLATGASIEKAELALEQTDWHVKTAIVHILTGLSAKESKQVLDQADGFVRHAIADYKKS